jgi:intein-encoded DNA endonuclease-like protein
MLLPFLLLFHVPLSSSELHNHYAYKKLADSWVFNYAFQLYQFLQEQNSRITVWKNLKGYGKKGSLFVLRYYAIIFLKCVRKTTVNSLRIPGHQAETFQMRSWSASHSIITFFSWNRMYKENTFLKHFWNKMWYMLNKQIYTLFRNYIFWNLWSCIADNVSEYVL